MVAVMVDKPRFTRDQIVPASKASKSFGKVRKNAKILPQFISQNNKIDSVVLDYEQYEKLFEELETLREMSWEFDIANRLKKADSTPNVRYSIQEVMGNDEYQEFCDIDPDSISDEELFG